MWILMQLPPKASGFAIALYLVFFGLSSGDENAPSPDEFAVCYC